jgi:hypothetical protein
MDRLCLLSAVNIDRASQSVQWLGSAMIDCGDSISDKDKHLSSYHLFRSSSYLVDIGGRSLRFEALGLYESPSSWSKFNPKTCY